MTLTQQLIERSSRYLNRPALRSSQGNLSYAAVLAQISRLSYLFSHDFVSSQSFSSKQAIRVAYLCRNSPAMVLSFLAISNVRGVNILLNPAANDEALALHLLETGATHLAVTEDQAARGKKLLQNYRLPLTFIEVEKKRGGEYDTHFSVVGIQAPLLTDPIFCLSSGGTTGKTKWVEFTHSQVIAGLQVLNSRYHLKAGENFFTALSWAHPFALIHGLLLPLFSGATVCLSQTAAVQPKPEGPGQDGSRVLGTEDNPPQAATQLHDDVVVALNFLAQVPIHRWLTTPPGLQQLTDRLASQGQSLPALQSISVSLGPLPPALAAECEKLHLPLLSVFGQTENLWIAAMQEFYKAENAKESTSFSLKSRKKPKNLTLRGFPGMNYKVMDPGGDPVESHQVRQGLLAVSSRWVMHHYWDDEKKTKSALRGSWLHSDDLFELNGSGEGDALELSWIARRTQTFSFKGGYITFSELSALLQQAPEFLDAAAFSILSGNRKPLLVFAIVKHPGVPLTERQVLEVAQARFPAHLQPALIIFVDTLPRDSGGSIHFYHLQLQYTGAAG